MSNIRRSSRISSSKNGVNASRPRKRSAVTKRRRSLDDDERPPPEPTCIADGGGSDLSDSDTGSRYNSGADESTAHSGKPESGDKGWVIGFMRCLLPHDLLTGGATVLLVMLAILVVTSLVEAGNPFQGTESKSYGARMIIGAVDISHFLLEMVVRSTLEPIFRHEGTVCQLLSSLPNGGDKIASVCCH